ncbi:glycosyltransferase [Cytobacillus sp. FSL R5-0596]|uniref:glycosyltransferase n=1 Tax=Cytobacillus sp. FSL R5-0596 TaxID=2954696 RepID=UPI0030F84133
MSNKKDNSRIAFILGGMGNGGAERVVSILANHYASCGKKVDILTLLSPNCTYHLGPNVRLICLAKEGESRKLQIFNWIFKLKKYYKEYRPYRMVSFFAKINIVVMIAFLRNIGDIIVSERNDPSKDGRGIAVKFLTNLLYPKTKRVIFQTKWAQSCFSKRVISNSDIVYNPIKQISSQRVDITTDIVNVGKLLDQKNHKLLISAFHKISKEFPENKLVIYGEGEKRKELENLIESFGLKGRVQLPGWTSEVHQKMASSQFFVLSSNYEGFSNALLEAMMIGVPCITTDCAGSNELIKNNVNGLITPVGCLEELVAAMRTMLGNPQLAEKLAEQGKKDVQKFSVDRVIGRWESVID